MQLLTAGLVAWVPVPRDHYQEFLDAIRGKIVRLCEDGYQVRDFIILPERDGTRTVRVSVSHPYSIVRTVCWEQKVA